MDAAADLSRHVDPFLGNGAMDLPEPEGIAASWFLVKAQTGNTHPGACAPYGMVSACPYSGAYVNGYGLNAPNSHARPPRRFDEYSASGFTHFHPSGTGAVGVYCNYFRVTPLVGDLAQLGERWRLLDETARPGYYAAGLEGTGIRAELTVGRRSALHRYAYPPGVRGRLAVDFSIGGLDFDDRRSLPERAALEVLSANQARGTVWMEGIPIHVHVCLEARAGSCRIFVGGSDRPGDRTLRLEADQARAALPFGAVFDLDDASGAPVSARLGFSFRSLEQAERNAAELEGRAFESVADGLLAEWNGYLERVRIEGADDRQLQILYSALYHCLIKPADCSGESPFWLDERPYFVDFATLWDQYKTLLPLMLSLYPERGADAVNGLLALGEHTGEFANGVLLSADVARFENQARALTHHVIADAFHRRLPGIDWRRALGLMLVDLHKERNRDFLDAGVAQPFTHTLDLADACACTAWLAEHLGDDGAVRELAALAGRWRNVYDPDTGRLGRSRYYEGGSWNYSFRLLHDMASRVRLYPDEAAFVADLDRFFGYGRPPVPRPVDPADGDLMAWGLSLNRFEGLNNEPDIEVPYAYLYAGRHDRTAEVVRAAMRSMFTTGRGGLPGNDDSGGLSSWYVWNAVALFPVTGQPLYLIGSPSFARARLQLGERCFEVRADDASSTHIHVQRARLNGRPLARAWLTVGEVHAGGLLELDMGPSPSGWAGGTRPPSFPLADGPPRPP